MTECYSVPHLPDKNTDELQAKQLLKDYNSTAEVVWNAYTEVSWAYNTDITEANKDAMVRGGVDVHGGSEPLNETNPYNSFQLYSNDISGLMNCLFPFNMFKPLFKKAMCIWIYDIYCICYYVVF